MFSCTIHNCKYINVKGLSLDLTFYRVVLFNCTKHFFSSEDVLLQANETSLAGSNQLSLQFKKPLKVIEFFLKLTVNMFHPLKHMSFGFDVSEVMIFIHLTKKAWSKALLHQDWCKRQQELTESLKVDRTTVFKRLNGLGMRWFLCIMICFNRMESLLMTTTKHNWCVWAVR